MKWTDGSIYMGLWQNGIQQGIGIMIFPDGTRRAGYFDQNVFKESIKSISEIDSVRNVLSDECIIQIQEYLSKRGRLGQENSQETI